MGGIVVGQGGRNGGTGRVFEGESDGGCDHGLIEGDGRRDGGHHAGCVGSRRLAGDGWDHGGCRRGERPGVWRCHGIACSVFDATDGGGIDGGGGEGRGRRESGDVGGIVVGQGGRNGGTGRVFEGESDGRGGDRFVKCYGWCC